MVKAECTVYDNLFNDEFTFYLEGSKSGIIVVKMADEIVDTIATDGLDTVKMKSVVDSIVRKSHNLTIKFLKIVEFH